MTRRRVPATAAALLIATTLTATACSATSTDTADNTTSNTSDADTSETSTAAVDGSTGTDASADAGDEAASEAGDGAQDGDVDVFDTGVVHSIDVSFDDDDFAAMLSTYAASGDKEWIEATVTIDGVTYDRAGLRLKGNSSLRGLTGGRPNAAATDADTQPDTDLDTDADADAAADEIDTAAAPEELPWLIRLDKFVDGQEHQGYEDFVVRSNNSETSLNEAVALDLLAAAGLASQEAMATSFTVNGSDAVLRLVIEHPDDDEWYEQAFDDALGALYKAESTGDWSYRGDDPASYEEVFDQEGGSDVADLAPLIEFLQFINESDDATFHDELPERLDVEAFATYLAMMDLIGNTDDIDGPGNNSYLWWDASTQRFTVVPWDMNLAFGSRPGGGGTFPGGGTGRAPGGRDVSPPTGGEFPEMPEGGFPEMPEGGIPEMPEGGIPEMPGGGFPGGTTGGATGRGGMGGRSNPLVTRFLADDEFAALYADALDDLRADLFDGGLADELLAARVATLLDGATALVDETTIESEADAISTQLTD